MLCQQVVFRQSVKIIITSKTWTFNLCKCKTTSIIMLHCKPCKLAKFHLVIQHFLLKMTLLLVKTCWGVFFYCAYWTYLMLCCNGCFVSFIENHSVLFTLFKMLCSIPAVIFILFTILCWILQFVLNLFHVFWFFSVIHTHTHTYIHISWIRHPFNDGLNMKLVINSVGLWYTVSS